jgi:hypothetical protein
VRKGWREFRRICETSRLYLFAPPACDRDFLTSDALQGRGSATRAELKFKT